MKKRFLSILLALCIIFSLFPCTAVAAEPVTQTTTATLTAATSAKEDENKLTIESYLTLQDSTTVTIKPCDIIFVFDQSKFMNNNGSQRETVINAMKKLLDSIATPTTGEHRVAIVGYGRVNVGLGYDEYNAAEYPGVPEMGSGISLNTGYYTTDSAGAVSFHSSSGWTDSSDSESIPSMPSAYENSITYDSAFMTVSEAKTVLDPNKMVAWYAGAARMDAGLTIANKLVQAANSADTEEDRDVIVCVISSTIPLQQNATYGNTFTRRTAVLNLGKAIKNAGATIYAYGSYYSTNQNTNDTKESFEATMTELCTPATGNQKYFFSLGSSENISVQLNEMIETVSLNTAGQVAQEATITASEFTVSPANSTIWEEPKNTITWNDIYTHYKSLGDDKLNTFLDSAVTVEIVRRIGTNEDGAPIFDEASPTQLTTTTLKNLSNAGIATINEDSFSYTTKLIPLLNTDGTSADRTYLGQKVIINISAPLNIQYQWLGGGENVPSDVALPSNGVITYGDPFYSTSVISQDHHYTFDGWYTDQECTKKYTDGTRLYDNITLYGRWIKYAEVFLYYRYNTEDYAKFLSDNTTPTVYDDLIRTKVGETPNIYSPKGEAGYSFGGWYTDLALRTAYTSSQLTDDLTLYAKWIPNADTQYTVKFYQQNLTDDNYTEVTDDAFTASGTTGMSPASITTTYSGFTLSRVTYEDSSHSAQTDPLTVAGDGSLVVCAYFDREKCTVKYDLEGGSGEVPADSAVKYGTVITVTDTTPTKTDYIFTGWKLSTTENITEPKHTILVTDNIVLTAQWEMQTQSYTVNYYLQNIDGTYPETPNLTETDYGKSGATVTAPEAYYPHFTINAEKSTLSGELNGSDSVILNVYYDRDSYTVTYHANYPYGTTDRYAIRTGLYESTIKILSGPSDDLYTFTGWNTREDGTGHSYDPEDPITLTENVVLYAQWAAPYTVSYNLNGGEETADASYPDQMVKQGDSITLPTISPYRDGYEFTGWSDGTTTYRPGASFTPIGDVTLTAQWSPKVVITPPTNPPKPTEAPKPTTSPEPTQPVETQEPTEPVETTEPTESPEPTEPAETIDPTESPEPTEPAETIDPTESPEPTEPVETTDPTESPEPSEIPDPIEEPDEPDVPTVPALDTENHIKYLNGYPDGSFRPERNMTRAEVAQMFYNLLLNPDSAESNQFTDVSDSDWYADAVNTLADMGILNGVGDDRFEPDRNVTRAEFTVIAMRFTQLATGGSNPFSDVAEDAWYYDLIVGASQYGWITGYPDGTFRPNDSILRSEVTAIVNRMLDRSADQDYMDFHNDELRQFTDLHDPTYWAYYDIREATNPHDYTRDDSERWISLSF